MGDFPANLDDGELWLPSDIFPSSDNHHEHHRHHHRPVPSCGPHQYRPFSHHRLEVYMPMAQHAVTAPSPNGCYVGPTVDHGLCNYGSGPTMYASPNPTLRYPMHKPVHSQALTEHLMETRIARTSSRPVVEGHQNRPLNRHFPFQASGLRFSCLVKDCRGAAVGTGVFIPRATTGQRTTTYDGGKRKPGMTPQRRPDPERKLGMGKAEEYYCYHQVPPSDVGLPNDWTY